MFRNSLLTFVISIGMVLSAQLAAFGQYAPTSGKVVLQKADGTREPVAGALVEVYRTDVKGGSPPSKTNKKGEFSFVGFGLGQTYAIVVSGPGISPVLRSNIKAGTDNISVEVEVGDGKVWTEEEVRSAIKAGANKNLLFLVRRGENTLFLALAPQVKETR